VVLACDWMLVAVQLRRVEPWPGGRPTKSLPALRGPPRSVGSTPVKGHSPRVDRARLRPCYADRKHTRARDLQSWGGRCCHGQEPCWRMGSCVAWCGGARKVASSVAHLLSDTDDATLRGQEHSPRAGHERSWIVEQIDAVRLLPPPGGQPAEGDAAVWAAYQGTYHPPLASVEGAVQAARAEPPEVAEIAGAQWCSRAIRCSSQYNESTGATARWQGHQKSTRATATSTERGLRTRHRALESGSSSSSNAECK
jgi:hypothetical protein